MLVVGTVQFVAAAMIAIGVAGRVAALVVIPIMVTVILTASIYATNGIVLLGCIGIVLLGTGDYSLWQPDYEVFSRLPTF